MAYTEFFVQTTGSDMNGGSSTSDSAAYTSTNGNYNGGTTFTPTDGSTPASSVNVGDFASVYNDGATAPVYVARVTAVAAGANGAITLSTTAKSGTAPTSSATARSIKVGGAWKGPNAATFHPFGFITNALTNASGDYPRVNFKSGTNYAITAAMTHSNAGPIYFQGYTSSAGDGGRATIDGGTSGASYTMLTFNVSQITLRDLIFQNNGASGIASGLVSSGAGSIERVVVNSTRGNGFQISGSSTLLECEAYGCNQSNTSSFYGIGIGTGGLAVRCVSHDNSGSNAAGFRSLNTGAVFLDCVADTNGATGFSLANGANLNGCVAYNNTGPGVTCSNSSAFYLLGNCVLSQNTTYGVNNTGSTSNVRLSNCAYYSNTSGQTNGAVDTSGAITLSGDPFTAASTGDFTLNNTAGAGAACRGTGRGAFTETQASYTGTVGYPDVGAAQSQASGGSGGVVVPTELFGVRGVIMGA